MKQNIIPTEIRTLIPFAEWSAQHPVLTNIILFAEFAALFIAVLFYDFTTH